MSYSDTRVGICIAYCSYWSNVETKQDTGMLEVIAIKLNAMLVVDLS